jgi:hypothetical protein
LIERFTQGNRLTGERLASNVESNKGLAVGSWWEISSWDIEETAGVGLIGRWLSKLNTVMFKISFRIFYFL